MADNFSLDDILAEIDAKKAGKNGDENKATKPAKDLSVTSIIGEEELSEAIKEAESLKKEPIKPEKNDFEEYKEQKTKKPSPIKEHKWEQKEIPAEKPKAKEGFKIGKPIKESEDEEETYTKPSKKDVVYTKPSKKEEIYTKPSKKEEAYTKPSKKEEAYTKPSKEEEVYSKPSKKDSIYTKPTAEKPQPEAELEAAGEEDYEKPKWEWFKGRKGEVYSKRPKERPTGMFSRIAEKIAVRVDEVEDQNQDDDEEDDEKAFAFAPDNETKSAEKPDLPEAAAPLLKQPPKKPAKQPLFDTLQRKLIDRQLKAEESFENPEELIDAINPYDVKSKAADPSVYLGGDTQGIAGNDLKRLSEETSPKKALEKDGILLKGSTVRLVDGGNDDEKWLGKTIEKIPPVKEYIPKKEKEKQDKNPLVGSVGDNGVKIARPTEKQKRSNDALLEKLNLALAKTHSEEEAKRKTAGLVLNATETGTVKAPTNGLNLDDGRVIMATGVLTDEDKVLKSKSKRKLRDFVMDGEPEEDEDDEYLDNYDASGEIWAELCESHRVIQIRLVLVAVITVFMGIVGLINDLGRGIEFNFFGADVTFLNKVENVQGYLFYNLIGGVIVSAICSSVLTGGISKLFKLKADCDSVCSVTMLAAIISNVVNIIRSDDVLINQAFVFIPAAAAGLMFNTLGKLAMIKRAKRNFRFISGDSAKYSAILAGDDDASALTKGMVGSVPVLAAIRKTELLTDFLKSSYCEDISDRISRKLVPAALGAALLTALISFFIPYGIEGLQNDIFHAVSVFTAVLAVGTPFAVMFVTNLPLTRAEKGLAKTDSVILGYQAAEDFAEVNAVMTDASLLFPGGTVTYSNIKHCKQPNSVNNIALDQAIILAASLAIKSGSVMSGMFKDMINDKDDILVKVENCVYEDNMGILGWYGNKRMIMGSRDQMKRHDIKVPDMKKVSKYSGENTDTIYLSVGGEIIIMFFVELKANPEVKACLQELTNNDVALVVKTTDSIVTVAKIAEVFDIPPEKIRILPYSMHERFNHYTKYVSRGSGAVSCNGTFSGFGKAIYTAKKLMKDISLGMGIMLLGALLGVVIAAAAALTGNTRLISSSMVMGWNLIWLIIAEAVQCFRRY